MYPHRPFTVASYLGARLGLGHVCDSRCENPTSALRMQIFVVFADGTFYPGAHTIFWVDSARFLHIFEAIYREIWAESWVGCYEWRNLEY
jgi:hypothetical protein